MADLEDKRQGAPRLPPVDAAMNRVAPKNRVGGKGAKDDGKPLGKEKKAKSDDELLSRMRKRFDLSSSASAENRKAALDDQKFRAGEQWPADVLAQRNADKRPCHTINKLKTFVHQVTNDQRQNRPQIKISPVGDKSDPKVAQMYAGLIRAIERDSTADIAYDTAFDGAAAIGFGYFRLLTEYETPDSFDQVLKIIRIRNPFTVYMGPSQEPDGADCKWGFITEMMPRDEFKEQWPDADQVPWDSKAIGEKLGDWLNKEEIRVAEYFEITEEKETLLELSNGFVGWEAELGDVAKKQLEDGAVKVLREREASKPKVKWYRATATEILERKDWVGQWIPIFPVIGDEIDIEGKVKLSGIIRDAKSPQQMYNYWATLLTEMIALQPKAPWTIEEGQVEGYEDMWRQAHTKSYAYLPYKATDIKGQPVPPPQRQPMAGIPSGIQQALMNAQQDMMAVTGIRFDSTAGERMYDESGKAINALQQRGELTNYHYIDNLARTMKHLGRCLIDAIPKVYSSKRIVTILREDDSEERVMIDPLADKPFAEASEGFSQANGIKKIFNPTQGRYGCTVTIGPSFATRRTESLGHMIDFAKAFPQLGEAIADLIAKNSDWPGGQELANRLMRIVAMKYPGILQPDMKDVPPQVQALMLNMTQQVKKLTLEKTQLTKMITDKGADRALKKEQIDKTYQAKVMAIEGRFAEAMAKINAKGQQDTEQNGRAVLEMFVEALMGEGNSDHTDLGQSGEQMPDAGSGQFPVAMPGMGG